MGHTRTALRVQMACSKQHVNSYLQQIAYSEIHFSRGGGGYFSLKVTGVLVVAFRGWSLYHLGC